MSSVGPLPLSPTVVRLQVSQRPIVAGSVPSRDDLRGVHVAYCGAPSPPPPPDLGAVSHR